MSAPWWETYEDRAPINYPRRDDAPVVRVAKEVKFVTARGHVSRPIYVFTKRSWVKP